MVILYHKNNKIVEVTRNQESILFKSTKIVDVLFEVAEKYNDELILWCHDAVRENLIFENISNIFHHKKIMASYNLSDNVFLSDAIGYVEDSPFIKINKKVSYPTWLMSSHVGGIDSTLINGVKDKVVKDTNFDYFLCSIAKLLMPIGLICYSEPNLVNNPSLKISGHQSSNFYLYRFVKQHYKIQWTALLFLNFILYERKITLMPFFGSIFYPRRKVSTNVLDKIESESSKKVVDLKTLDVIIPTIGRKKYLYDVLKDLAVQTHLPKNVVIIEQNPDYSSISELDYLISQIWPFKIKHTFTHEAGACNARNLALAEIESEWVFMADDDIRIDANLIEKAFEVIEKQGFEQITLGCYATNYPSNKKIKGEKQWSNFGSGCSIVKSKNITTLSYNTSFEFGYGEDSDFGMQLRNLGFDILYVSKPEIFHLKAPVGGFRTKPVLAWAEESIQPKPSPTVMLYKILNLTQQQLDGYQTVLFFKFYKFQPIKNPIMYYYNYRKQWKQSLHWANKLNKK